MPQHKIYASAYKTKNKTNKPKGVKQNIKKQSKNVPKKGTQVIIAPKKATAVQQSKISSQISKIINEKNEEMLKARADKDQGRNPKS
uniref:Uncharacterized protein n=1 Tax=Acrobeloides nanus TaxID=290746 RepID=A0A914CI33_9BILA